MSGSNGVLAPILKHLLESMLAGELDNHLGASKTPGQANRKTANGREPEHRRVC
jgi:putative transposase